MVVAARLHWILRQAQNRYVHMSFNSARDHGQTKVKFVIDPGSRTHADVDVPLHHGIIAPVIHTLLANIVMSGDYVVN